MSGKIVASYLASRASVYWLFTGVGSIAQLVGGLLVELLDADRGGV